MPDIIKVRRIDGVFTSIDLEPLDFRPLSHGIEETNQKYIVAISVKHVMYFHADMMFIVETTITEYQRGRCESRRLAWQVITEEWLAQRGYEKVESTRSFAEKAGLSNAKYPDLFKRAGKRQLIDEPIELPEGTWWVLWRDRK